MAEGAGEDSGKTFFTELLGYPDVKEGDTDIELAGVLAAAEAFLPFFDVFGSMLKICKNDILGNITKLKTKSGKIPEAKTFGELMKFEIENKQQKEKDSACIAALWFKRGLQFITAYLEEFSKHKEENMSVVMDAAYGRTLKKYHNWIVQKGILMVSKLVPYRKDIIVKLCLGKGELEPQLVPEVEKYLLNLRLVANTLHNLVIELGQDSEDKV